MCVRELRSTEAPNVVVFYLAVISTLGALTGTVVQVGVGSGECWESEGDLLWKRGGGGGQVVQWNQGVELSSYILIPSAPSSHPLPSSWSSLIVMMLLRHCYAECHDCPTCVMRSDNNLRTVFSGSHLGKSAVPFAREGVHHMRSSGRPRVRRPDIADIRPTVSQGGARHCHLLPVRGVGTAGWIFPIP